MQQCALAHSIMPPKKRTEPADFWAAPKAIAKAKAKAKAKGKARARDNTFESMFESAVQHAEDAEQLKDGEAKEVDKKDQMNFVNQLGATSPADPKYAEKVKALETYKSMSFWDPRKKELVSKWLTNKGCDWINTFEQTTSLETEKVKTELNGKCTKFQIAKELGLTSEDDKGVLDEILAEIQCDDDWDESKPLERAFKKAKLKRYHFEFTDFEKSKKRDKKSERFTSSKDSKGKQSVVEALGEALSAGTSSASGGEPQVVISHPEYIELRNELSILSTGEERCGQVQADMKKNATKLKMIEGAETRVTETTEFIEKLDAMHDGLLEWIFKHEGVQADEDPAKIKEMIKEAVEKKKETQELLENGAKLHKKISAFFQSQ